MSYTGGALRAGEALSSKAIAGRVSAATGREVSASDLAGSLRKISDTARCDLGHFVRREQKDGVYVYRLVEEARPLSEDRLYGLTLKGGAERYPLDRALADFPRLARYVEGKAVPAPGGGGPIGAGKG